MTDSLSKPKTKRKAAAVVAPAPAPSRKYKRRPGAAPHWPLKRYRWAYLQDVMLSRNLKPAELAVALGCDLAPIYEWLNGTDLPRPHNIIKIADALFVDKQDLLGSFPVGD